MQTADRRLKVALYARVSGEEQKQGHNIDSQIAELKQFAAQNGWQVTDVYSDEAWSGAALARPALDRLRDDAGREKFDAVLINDVDRLARDVTHLGIIKRDLEHFGVQVIFRKIPSENRPTHNLLVNVLGSFAEFERELIMDRTRRGKRHKAEVRQQFIGGIPPYGYHYVASKKPGIPGALTVNPEEAAVVRTIYQWVDAEGISAHAVAARLTAQRIPPRKHGSKWQRSSVLRILRSTIVAGTWYYNKHRRCAARSMFSGRVDFTARKSSNRLRSKKEWIPVALPDALRIISPEQWSRVQEQLDRNRSFSPRNSHHEYLLSGLVQCAGCRARYVGNPSHGAFQYRCVNRCKRVPMVSERILDDTVWTAVKNALDNPDLLAEAIREFKWENRPADGESQQIQQALESLRTEEARVLEAYRLSVINSDQLSGELGLIAGRRQALKDRELAIHQPKMSNLPIKQSVHGYCAEVRRRLSRLTFETQRSVLRLLLRAIAFEGDRVIISGVIPVSVSRGIATTASCRYGHNPAGQDYGEAEFVLVSKIVRNRQLMTP
jgi:site-specific DNA recombinase